jgi:hypothetical protein
MKNTVTANIRSKSPLTHPLDLITGAAGAKIQIK